MKTFVLAAGKGERLRPITDHIPKPLLPICGRPIIEIIIEKLIQAGIESIGLNIHHGKKSMERWLRDYDKKEKITCFFEEKLLGTGGALKNAESFLRDSPFIVHNSDIISDINLKELIEFHLSSKNMATLCVHDFEEFNNLSIKGTFFEGIRKEGDRAYTGISIYQPDFLDLIPYGFSHLPDIWMDALKKGAKIGIYEAKNGNWIDIGRPLTFARAVFMALKEQGENIFVHEEVDIKDIEFEGFLCIEKGSTIANGAKMKNCVILNGTVKEKEKWENSIIGPGFSISLKEHEIFGFREGDPIPIGFPGSNRRFFRTKLEESSVIVMKTEVNDEEFERFITYTDFFRKYGFPVPEIHSFDSKEKWAMVQDLGDMSLYSWLKIRKDPREIEAMYKKVLDMVLQLHREITDHVSECPLLKERIFDKTYFKWETQYFMEWFVFKERGISINATDGIYTELEKLSEICDSYPKGIIHRDLQSRNIMIKDSKPFFIDYQGARMGPPGYDIASLLWDPYFRLDEGLRIRLLEYYIQNMKSGDFDDNLFRESLPFLRTQRHMQALGAYAFLSIQRGKTFFRKYMPQGLRLLREDIELLPKSFKEIKSLGQLL